MGNTFTFGLISPLNDYVQQAVAVNGGLYQAAQFLAGLGRDLLLAAATGGANTFVGAASQVGGRSLATFAALRTASAGWEVRETMTGADIEQIIQRAREKFPGVTPRIISDKGPQFIARDFKEFIRI